MIAIALFAGCDEQPTAEGSGGTTSTDEATGDADDGLCVPGYEGCACFDEERCISGLECLSNHCVSVPTPDDTSSDEGSTTDVSTSDSSTGDATNESSSSGDESSSTGLPDVCVDEDTYCDDDELQTCESGQWVMATCEEACGATGFGSLGCGDADRCSCAGHIDAVCDLGTSNHCICLDALYGTPSCTSTQQDAEYQACVATTTASNTCWASISVSVIEDCESLVAGCGT